MEWQTRLYGDQLLTILIEIFLSYDIKGGNDVFRRNSVLFQNAKQVFKGVWLKREQMFSREYLHYHASGNEPGHSLVQETFIIVC